MKFSGLLSTGAFCAISVTTLSQVSFASTYTVLSNFPADGPDVSSASLTQYKDVLFGTCESGGKADYGGVFKVHLKNGKKTILHGFSGTPDGEEPQASLTKVGNLLYGTTTGGGKNDGGTIYTVNPMTGEYDTVHSFPGTYLVDSLPSSPLVPYGSTLIGTTLFGGHHERGSLYQFDPATGTVTTLHAFRFYGKNPDGHMPYGAPLVVGHKVYGVTIVGGEFDEGTLYEFDITTGREKPLFSFSGGAVGYQPTSNLVKVGDGLYGTVPGYHGNGPPNYGTVYRFDLRARTAALVHAFSGQAGSDGANPNSELTYANGLIYGTTNSGGSSNFGTVYTVDPATGAETTLYSFTNGVDGGTPLGGLISSHGSFYGTTTTGGTNGTGTVFSFTP